MPAAGMLVLPRTADFLAGHETMKNEGLFSEKTFIFHSLVCNRSFTNSCIT